MRNDELRAAVDRLNSLLAETNAEDGITFGELWSKRCSAKLADDDRWYAGYGKRIRPVLSWFEDWPALMIGKASWAEYFTARRECRSIRGERISTTTINLELDLLKATYRWAEDQGLINQNPVLRIRRARMVNRSQSPMREEHINRVLAECKHDIARAYFLVGMDGGARQDEIRHIRWANIDFETREVDLRVTKGKKPRVIVLTGRALDAINRVAKVDGSPFVFTNPTNGKLFAIRTLSRWAEKAIKKSGIELEYDGGWLRSHALRHGYATNAVERGVDIRAVQNQLGHSTLRMTERYLHARRDHLREAAEIFEAGIGRKRRGPHRAPTKNEGEQNLLDQGLRSCF